MARYVTNFKLKSAVNDFGAAKKYLADADMTKYLIDDLRDYENMPELADKIVHIEWNLEEDWYGTINLETTEDVSKQDLAVILEWVKGQNSDGLGEGFEQRNFARFYDEKRGRYYLASFMRRLPQFTKVSDSRKVTDSEDDNIKSVTMRFGDFLNWYFNINVGGNVDADFLYKNDWDYLASGNGLSLDEVADIFNENYDTQVEFTQYDIGNAKVIDWDLNDIGFEADSMDWLPGLEEVSDSLKIKDNALDMQFIDFECTYVDERDSGIETFTYSDVYDFEDFRQGISDFRDECKARGFEMFMSPRTNGIKLFARDANRTVFEAIFDVMVDTRTIISMLINF